MALSESAIDELLNAIDAGDGTDLIRDLVGRLVQELIEAEAAAVIGVDRYERTGERLTHRNGDRSRVWSTKAGDLGSHRFKSSDELLAMLPMELQILVHVGQTVVAADGRAVPGEWEEGPKPPSPLDAELDAIIEHAWDSHVASDPSEFPEVQTPEEMKELLEEIIDNATEWGYGEDGAVYWYDDVTDTVVIKNPAGIGGTTYRPGPGEGG